MKTIEFKVKAVTEGDDLFIEGFAVKYDIVDETIFKDKLVYGCCSKTLKENKNNIRLLFEHDRTRVIGKITQFMDSTEGLFIKAKISEAEPEIRTKIKEGLYDSFSIGFMEIKSTPIFNDKQEFQFNEVTEIKLREVSLVSFPAFKTAKFNVTKSLYELERECETEEEFIEKAKSLVNEPNHSTEPEHSADKPIEFEEIIKQISLI
jgi:HK97 family phage prohead protease